MPSYDMITFSIVDQCNLSCQSCPAEHISRTGKLRYAPVDFCRRVFAKIARDYGNPRIPLYCLSEPLLHPDLPGVLDAAAEQGLTVEISTNLNTQRDLAPIIEHPALERLDISLDAFTQETYIKGHARGRMEIVKSNMRRMAEMRHDGKVYVKFLRYNDNAEEELLMQEFAESLGFQFRSFPATYFPYGDILEAVTSGREYTPPAEAAPLLSRLLTRDFWRVVPTPAFSSGVCHNQESILFINYAAKIYCCNFATYHEFGQVGDLLDLPPDELHRLKQDFPFCQKCHKAGVQGQNAIKCALENEEELQAFFAFLDRQDMSAAAGEPIYIYGAGWLGRHIRTILAGKGLPVRGFIDDSPALGQTVVDGLPVTTFAALDPEEGRRARVLLGFFAPHSLMRQLDARIRAGGNPRGLQQVGAFFIEATSRGGQSS